MANNYKYIRTNKRIRSPQILLVGSGGEQIGVVPTQEGLQKAQEEGLDLVEMAPNAKPPVCRILDFGKYLYDLKKKDKEAKRKQKNTELKEIKLTAKIGKHDYDTKLRNARRFLERGDKVKLTLFFRGREVTHADLGKKMVKRFMDDVADLSEIERNFGLSGKTIQVYLSPSAAIKRKQSKKVEKGTDNAKTKDK